MKEKSRDVTKKIVSILHNFNQVPQLFVDLRRCRDRVGDLEAEELAIGFLHAVQLHAQGAFAHAQLVCDVRVGAFFVIAREETLQLLEALRLAGLVRSWASWGLAPCRRMKA